MIHNDIIYSFFVFVILTLLSRRCCMTEFLSCFTKYNYRFIVERLNKYLMSFYKLRLRHWLVRYFNFWSDVINFVKVIADKFILNGYISRQIED